MDQTLSIDPRFCGPPEIGNGGYVAGLLARRISGPAAVALRAPAPLAKPLRIRRGEAGRLGLYRGETLLASAEPASVAVEPPPAPDAGETLRRAGSCRAFQTHPFPRCFVCGPEREPGDGMRIFPGPVPGTDRVAAPWLPAAEFADAAGYVRTEFVWAALDSPSSFPLLEDEASRRLEPMVLGKLAIDIAGPVVAGEPHSVVAWPLSLEGRRGVTGVALYRATGDAVAWGRATWVSLAGR
jgi:hypothetical protein